MAKLQTSTAILAARPRSGDAHTAETIRGIRQGYQPAVLKSLGYADMSPECDGTTGGPLTCAVRECNK